MLCTKLHSPQEPTIFIWLVHQIVLHWVKSQKQLPAFVCHRITEIQLTFLTAEWTYCPTLKKPTDLLTKGLLLTLISSSLWQNGPTRLTTPDKWPLFDQSLLPPLLVAAAVATKIVPTDPATPTGGCTLVSALHNLTQSLQYPL